MYIPCDLEIFSVRFIVVLMVVCSISLASVSSPLIIGRACRAVSGKLRRLFEKLGRIIAL